MKKSGNRYSIEFKAKLIEEYQTGNHSVKDIAKIFGIALSSACDWIDKYYGKGQQNQYGLKSKV